jgi:hypothetical protein
VSKTMTQAERITTLEAEVSFLRQELREMKDDTKATNAKLDVLLALRNKGAGAFWLASVIFGTSLVGFATIVLSWIKG